MDLEPFAHDLGYEGPPFRWNAERRFLLRCELDAAFFHLYGIDFDDVDYIMETFLVFKCRNVAAHGEYRTKRVILEIYDQMARAAETGQPYQTLLDPPPADLDLPASEPASVTPLRQHTQPEPERPARDRGVEERVAYEVQPSSRHHPEPEAQGNGAAEPDPTEKALSVTASSHHQVPDEPQDTLFERPAPEVLSLDDAALALHDCVPDGEKVERDVLLGQAAHELGYPNLTRIVRRALNKALSAENNAGCLRTDWERVWRPKKR